MQPADVRAGIRRQIDDVELPLYRLLAAVPDAEILETGNGRDALALMRSARPAPAMVVLDLNLPGIGGIELLRRLLQENPAARIMVLSMHAEALYASRALQAGARGYVSKAASPDELLVAIRRVLEGGRYIEAEIAQELALQNVEAGQGSRQLTERDLEILRMLGEGRSLGEISDALGLSYKTVANTCTLIKGKLGVERMADLVRLSIEMGIRG